MTFDTLFSFLTDSAGVIAVVLYVAGVLILLHSMRVQDQSTHAQSALISQLREHLAHSVKAQVELHDHVNLLHERYTELVNRQQRVETRSPDSRRIDTAMRMLKRGTADALTLQDLGLTSGEAKLLLRLHGTSAHVSKRPSDQTRLRATQAPPRRSRAPAGIAHPDTVNTIPSARQKRPEASNRKPMTHKPPVAAQGRALAQLLEA